MTCTPQWHTILDSPNYYLSVVCVSKVFKSVLFRGKDILRIASLFRCGWRETVLCNGVLLAGYAGATYLISDSLLSFMYCACLLEDVCGDVSFLDQDVPSWISTDLPSRIQLESPTGHGPYFMPLPLSSFSWVGTFISSLGWDNHFILS